jgi:uncharacterized DUF497 family protein
MIKMDEITGFEWDEGNMHKNFFKHNVTNTESEQVFFNQPLIVANDFKHSELGEIRYIALGKTNDERYLTVIFTIRKTLIRVISARNMSRKERMTYGKSEEK